MKKIPKFTIVTQNVRALGHGTEGVWKRHAIRDHFSKLNPSPDIILLQEHHYNNKDCLALTSQLNFLKGPTLWNEGTYSARTDKTKAGTAILLSSALRDSILDSGILIAGRAQYVILRLNPTLKIGILNIYAHNDSQRRAKLWDLLTETNLPEAEWIMGGDFNSVESLDDRIGRRCTTGMEPREMEAWSRLLMKHNFSDSFLSTDFRRLNKKLFS